MLMRVCGFLMVGFLLAAAPVPKEADTDQKKLMGKWSPESMERGGEKAPARVLEIVLEFTKDEVIIHGPEDRKEKAKYKLSSTKKPAQIDILPEKGEDRVVKGIYEIKDGTLRMCWVEGKDKERPKEFKSPEGTRQTLAVLKRKK